MRVLKSHFYDMELKEQPARLDLGGEKSGIALRSQIRSHDSLRRPGRVHQAVLDAEGVGEAQC